MNTLPSRPPARRRPSLALALALLALPGAAPSAPVAAGPDGGDPTSGSPAAVLHAVSAIDWQDWSPAVFERAGRERRLVLLDLGAVWCHWCHVMEQTTYADARVVGLLQEHFVAVRVDQDARPDLANRYEDYGWPATVIFAADGSELVKFQGYIPPERMLGLLRGVRADPTPGPSVLQAPAPELAGAAVGVLAPELRAELEALLAARYDQRQGGWGFSHKFLDWDAVEWSLRRARAGAADAERRARQTLDRQLALLDPVWGGVYQYSDSGDWEHPHYEKIMSMQAENLRVYAMAYAQWGEAAHLQAARRIQGFLAAFLSSPEGLFYTSMDADLQPGRQAAEYFALDDAGRRARGLPRVDRHLYARENAWAAQALLALHAVTGEEALLERARHVGRWLLAARGLPGGGLRHDESDPAGPYLGDSLAGARLFLALYSACGERAWLERTRATLAFVERHFRVPGIAGYVTAAGERARPQREENAGLARLAVLAYHYTGDESLRNQGREALRHVAIPEVARRPQTGGVLLADDELRSEPLHVTVVGRSDDPAAQTLLRAARALPEAFKRVELWDRRHGPLPRADVSYPELARAAAFVCSAGRCSAPAFTRAELGARVARLQGATAR